MPFNFKLKKTRQYNVASKSLFVISVELLDGGVADCTLSVDSTGQECLDNVCQRQAINQPEFFGLRYINRTQQPRWVQLERPLKRQLDKYASSHQLYLRVMYYVVSGTSLITDEVTRYHYFLQLKNDLVEGRIICDCQQAVVLASYSRQAEYGNHDRERHTVEYLKNLLTFPKQMIDGGQIIESSSLAESGKLEWLTSAVIQHHMTLHNMSQAQAEEGFISACQLLRGYGQEMFVAQDQLTQSEVTIAISLSGIMVLSETSDTPHFYRWTDITNVINHKRTFSIECASGGESATYTLRTPDLGKYVWRVCVLQHTFYMRHQQPPPPAAPHPAAPLRPAHAHTTFQEHGLSESREELDGGGGGGGGEVTLQPLSPSHRAHSTSCLELQHQGHGSQLGTHRRGVLPQYRPAPDYETAVQQKYQQQRADAQLRYQQHPHAHAHAAAEPRVYGSHPDIHRVHYPDVTRHNQPAAPDEYPYGVNILSHGGYAPFALNPNVQTELNPRLQYVNVYKPPPPYPSSGLASSSTPDLAAASHAFTYRRGYIASHVSGSSPDLVSSRPALGRHYLGYLTGGNVTVLDYQRAGAGAPHGTYSNLAAVLDVPNPHIIMDPHRSISDNIQKVYDERGNVMYSMPMHRVPYQQRRVLQPPAGKPTEPHEPIYENVPLPAWRDRAHSLTTTTDELARLNASQPSGDQHAHYVNAHVMHGVRESSVPPPPPDLTTSSRDLDTVTLSVDTLSMRDDKDHDETPYQSLSTHRLITNNNNEKRADSANVTSISVPDVRSTTINSECDSRSSGADGALTNSTMNTTYSLELDSGNTTKSGSVSSKEKKRRRWGVFMGRGNKTVDVKSATLGRDRAKPAQGQPPNKHRWSTGLPKFQPLPPSITKETLCQLLERKMSESQLAFAFEQIPKGRERGGEMTTALLPENSHLNGYSSENLPYEDNRVKLHPTPANRHGYINASHITMTVGSSQRFYVVAKVSPPLRPKLTSSPPSVEQAALLWECAWVVGARVVAAVGGPDRHVHLPPDNQTHEYGKFQVCVTSVSTAAWGASRRVRVRCGERGGARPRDLWHVSYTRWAQGDAPQDTQPFLDFLSELNGLRLACAAEGGDSAVGGGGTAPVVFCCAQGGGRSGTALAADLLLHILDNNQELDIPRTVSLLHQQRANLIQSVHQYRFLHQLLLHYLKQSRLI